MRQRIARLGTSRAQTPVLDPLFRVIRANHPKADLPLIERAYRTAESYHRGQTRRRAATPTSPTRWPSPRSWPSWA